MAFDFMKTIQIVALILGILGGLAGIGSALAFIGLCGSVRSAIFQIENGVGALVFFILGIIGAGIVGRNPKASGVLMILSSIVGFFLLFPLSDISIFRKLLKHFPIFNLYYLYLSASALFLVGGILAFISSFISRKKE